MFADRIEAKWIKLFQEVLTQCGVTRDSMVGIVCETQSRELNVHLAELALGLIGARQFRVVAQSPGPRGALPLRSAGTSGALVGLGPIFNAFSTCDLVLDLTIEGTLHSPELQELLGAGPRFLHILNEHPEVLERLAPTAESIDATQRSAEILAAGKEMRITSPAGTNLVVDLSGQHAFGVPGVVRLPGEVAHWPGGLAVSFPTRTAVNGTVVLDKGDINCTFKRYVEDQVTMTIKDGMIAAIDGEGADAALFKTYSESWNDEDAFAIAHVGWGTNAGARWETLALVDKRDTNAIEARAFAGNFLLGVGASHFANRFTDNHFDLPMRNTTIVVDGRTVVEQGKLLV